MSILKKPSVSSVAFFDQPYGCADKKNSDLVLRGKSLAAARVGPPREIACHIRDTCRHKVLGRPHRARTCLQLMLSIASRSPLGVAAFFSERHRETSREARGSMTKKHTYDQPISDEHDHQICVTAFMSSVVFASCSRLEAGWVDVLSPLTSRCGYGKTQPC